jgi:hypothetical protein
VRSTPTEVAPREACESFARDNRSAIVSLGALPPEIAQIIAQDGRDAAGCSKLAGATWGIRFGQLKFDANEGGAAWGKWSLVHVSRSAGSNATAAITAFEPPDSEVVWSPAREVRPKRPVLYDFDADGSPEALVVVAHTERHEGGVVHEWQEGRLWTLRGGRLSLYPATSQLVVERMADAEGDGRPDLFTRGPYTGFATIECGSGERYPVLGPLLVMHSMAGGGFSSSDTVARAAARRECPESPRPVLVPEKRGPGIELARSAYNVACARLWGESLPRLTAELAANCPSAQSCEVCDNPELLRRWATLEPPLKLP